MREGFKVDNSYVDIKMKLLDIPNVPHTYHEEKERTYFFHSQSSIHDKRPRDGRR
jgi:hypothetical protein